MRKRSLVGWILSICMATATVLAAAPHWKPRLQPLCTISDATASCTAGTVAGLGNADLKVTVALTATAGTFCHNPGNSNVVPGQNPANATGSSSLTFTPDQIKNGSLTIPALSATAVVAVPTPEVAGCPNPNWSVSLGEVSYTGTYTVEQPIGTVLAGLSFSF